MRISQYVLFTLKESPADAELVSHRLMLRAGMIRKLASGLYTWLPTGLRVIRKVENIIREEMNKIGAIEIAMPLVQPVILWKESNRFIQYGPELLCFTDRSGRDFVLGPTHEEVITDLIRNEISSYKELPLNFYQIKTKFRDEMRPCFGVIRSREFIMKDAYSFHINQNSLQSTYDNMYQVYSIILKRIGLKFQVVQADAGSTGGNISHEFQVLTKNVKDCILLSENYVFSTNREPINFNIVRVTSKEPMRMVYEPTTLGIFELIKKIKFPVEKTVKTIIIRVNKNSNFSLIALIIRGDHQLNKIKVAKLPQIATSFSLVSAKEIRRIIGAHPESLGPVNLPIPMIIDHSVALMHDFTAGANIDYKYFFGINWERDLPVPEIADLIEVINGDFNLDNKNTLKIKDSIEVAHIFQLGKKYSKLLKATVQDECGRRQTLMMGCYGIGINRVIAALIEQNHDKYGILWPDALAPFNVAILPINMHKSYQIKEISENIYQKLQACGIDTILYDRKERLGVMFTNVELIGIPHILVIGNRAINSQEIEYQNRRDIKKEIIKLSYIIEYLSNKILIKNNI